MSTTQGSPEELQGQGWLAELGWLGAGAVLPISSLAFYRRVVRRPPLMALSFMLAFGLAVGLLSSIGVTHNLGSLESEVRQALVESDFPTITIEDGVASADIPQPYTFNSSDQVAFIIDTTGQINRLDPNIYDQGMLLTATELHVLNLDGDYNITDLDDLNLLFAQDPLVVNADTISELAGGFASVFSVIVFVVLLAWHIFVRLVWLTLVALIVWALTGTFWKGVKFADIWVIGAYSSIPALYLTYLLSKTDVSICGIQTFLLGLIMLAVANFIRPTSEEIETMSGRVLNLHYAWIGLPLLLVLAYDLIFTLPYSAAILWGVTLATVATLVVLEYFAPQQGIKQL